MNQNLVRAVFPLVFYLAFISCTRIPESFETVADNVRLQPDYSEITIPENISPLNFKIEEDGEGFALKIISENRQELTLYSKKGEFRFSEKNWKKLLKNSSWISYVTFVKRGETWYSYPAFKNYVLPEKIDPFLYYRLLYPGYESWSEISIVQRNLENFSEKTVVNNNAAGQNCVNCHSFNAQNPDNFMFHMRGSHGGTFILNNNKLEKFNLKTAEMENGAVYPRWHPSGNFVAFSSNKVVQQFHSAEEKKIEVSDLNSSLVLFDVMKNEILQIPVDLEKQYMDTYPEWSPDGNSLYFCRARQISENYNYQDVKYNLFQVEFTPETRQFGKPVLVFDAEKTRKSVSFPRISPDGNMLVFTLHDYGCFSIWHKEADLYFVDLISSEVGKLELNSDFSESYHSWSSNGKWLVFSSKRGDGLTARPYISFIGENGKATKPFVLPQEDPAFYNDFLKTFNIPELSKAEISFTPGEIRNAASQNPKQASWAAQ